jgi:hypothetical protein
MKPWYLPPVAAPKSNVHKLQAIDLSGQIELDL